MSMRQVFQSGAFFFLALFFGIHPSLGATELTPWDSFLIQAEYYYRQENYEEAQKQIRNAIDSVALSAHKLEEREFFQKARGLARSFEDQYMVHRIYTYEAEWWNREGNPAAAHVLLGNVIRHGTPEEVETVLNDRLRLGALLGKEESVDEDFSRAQEFILPVYTQDGLYHSVVRGAMMRSKQHVNSMDSEWAYLGRSEKRARRKIARQSYRFAQKYCEEGLEFTKTSFGPETIDHARMLDRCMMVKAGLGQYSEGLELGNQALAIFKKERTDFATVDLSISQTLLNISEVYATWASVLTGDRRGQSFELAAQSLGNGARTIKRTFPGEIDVLDIFYETYERLLAQMRRELGPGDPRIAEVRKEMNSIKYGFGIDEG